jgi:hypothetical protein
MSALPLRATYGERIAKIRRTAPEQRKRI